MRVPDIIKDCVCFVCYRGEHGIRFAGTAFFIAYDSTVFGVMIGYTVSAWHVIVDIEKRSIDKKVLLRLNTLDGNFDYIETEIDEWVRHPSDTSVDAAIYGAMPPINKYQFNPYDISLSLTPEIARTEDIGIGDEVFMTGLFVRQSESKKNLPILRQGTIAMMPEEKISTENFGSIEAFLVEVRSLGGLSGSPAFVYLSPARRTRAGFKFQAIAYLLGLVHGHYEDRLPQPDDLVDDSSPIRQINAGIAVVVPADKILETLEHERFVEMRQKKQTR